MPMPHLSIPLQLGRQVMIERVIEGGVVTHLCDPASDHEKAATAHQRGAVRGWTPMPAIGPRYWAALCLASVLGADTGDILSRSLGLGYWHGLPLLAAVFVATVLAARLGRPAEAYYWLGIVIVRTAATNLADWQTLDVGQPMLVTAGVFGVILLALVARRRLVAAPRVANGFFWAAMLAAGTVGTAIGDDLAFGQDLGPPLAAACSTVTLVAVLGWRATSRLPELVTFWITVVVIRTWGTNVGDMTADRWGLIPAAAVVLTVFVGLLFAWRAPSVDATDSR